MFETHHEKMTFEFVLMEYLNLFICYMSCLIIIKFEIDVILFG